MEEERKARELELSQHRSQPLSRQATTLEGGFKGRVRNNPKDPRPHPHPRPRKAYLSPGLASQRNLGRQTHPNLTVADETILRGRNSGKEKCIMSLKG
jgi:hypothetical protein